MKGQGHQGREVIRASAATRFSHGHGIKETAVAIQSPKPSRLIRNRRERPIDRRRSSLWRMLIPHVLSLARDPPSSKARLLVLAALPRVCEGGSGKQATAPALCAARG